jgi:hypothetical protein
LEKNETIDSNMFEPGKALECLMTITTQNGTEEAAKEKLIQIDVLVNGERLMNEMFNGSLPIWTLNWMQVL